MLKVMKQLKNLERERHDNRQGESGNVLFLILIAVALFAALSYAVTSSSRSGGGDANSETNLISSASLTQYPASVRTAIIRMIISNGVDETEINFDPPPYDDLTTTQLEEEGVFHPSGGGATFVTAPGDVMDTGDGTWYFSGNYKVEEIGLDTTDGTGNEIIAFLPGIRQGVCNRINEELGLDDTGADTITSNDIDVTVAALSMDFDYAFPTAVTADIATDAATLVGQPFGCVTDSAGERIYYHVLIER